MSHTAHELLRNFLTAAAVLAAVLVFELLWHGFNVMFGGT
jgi:hypothetical protein